MIVEIELLGKDEKERACLLFDIVEEKLFVDVQSLPPSCFLCAMFDGVSAMKYKFGEDGKEESKLFIPMDWVIDQWGGDEDLVHSIRIRREIEMSKLEHYKRKYL